MTRSTKWFWIGAGEGALLAPVVGGPPTLGVIVWCALTGCGASQTETRYAAEVAHCLDNERAIVAREGTTADEDEADLDAERARCDATLADLLDAERAEVTDEAE